VPQNYILSTVGPDETRELTRASRHITFSHGDILGHDHTPIRDLFFPSSGMVSIVVELEDGECVETAMVGYRGVLGSAAAFGGDEHVGTGFGQIPGEGWLVPRARAIALCERNGAFRHLLFRQEQYMLAQAQQTAACNGRHMLSRRLASWLLRARAITGSDQLGLTQEYLAHMLGVQRATVSVAAAALADTGAIDYRRGRVQIRDADLLGAHACECHRALAERRTRLFSCDSPVPA